MLRLEFHNLAKRYNRRQVFSGLDGAVEDGRCLVVTGPNGSGKSTLVRVLCGLARPSAGEVWVGTDGARMAPADCRADIGVVAPDLAMYHELTALENLAFFASVRGLSPAAGALERLLDKVGLDGRGADLVGSYSSGMRQRLKYAQALIHQPRLLFLDEPTANLDERGRALVAAIVADQKQRGLLVIATNEPQEVGFGDEVLSLAG